MLGRTPPEAMVTVPRSLESSSSLRMASWMWRGHDAGLLVVAGRVAGELEDLGGEVLEDGGEVHGGTGTDAGGVLANLEVARDAADGELEARLRGARDGFLPDLPLPRPDMMYELFDVTLSACAWCCEAL